MRTIAATRTIAVVIAVALALQGCAGVGLRPAVEYRPIVDTQNVIPAQYEADVAACQEIARQVNAEQSAVNGAVAGAILGTLVGAAFGLRGRNLAAVAAYGAGSGAVHYAEYAGMTQIQIIGRCMMGRGYNVLA